MMEEYNEHEEDGVLSEDEIIAIQEEYRSQKIKEALMGWIISTIVNVACLVAACLIWVGKEIKEDVDVVATVPVVEEIPEVIPPEPPPEPEPQEPTPVEDSAETSVPTPDAPVDVGAFEDINDDAPSTDDDAETDTVCDVKTLNTSNMSAKIFGGRSAAGRKGSLARYGAGNRGQANLAKALRWLASVQNPDGSWGTKEGYHDGLSGLATLVFLAHGETPKSKNFGTTVKKAISWLAASPNKVGHSGPSYGHAAKTYALAEAYTMTGNYEIKRALVDAVRHLASFQLTTGNYDYFNGATPNPSNDSSGIATATSARQDNSLTSLCWQALNAASHTGIDFEHPYGDLHEVTAKVAESAQNELAECNFSYSGTGNNKNHLGLQGAGLFCLYLTDPNAKTNPQSKRLLADNQLGRAHKDLNWAGGGETHPNPYSWYYITNAFFQDNGKNWKAWNKKFQDVLNKNQNPAGYWQYMGKAHGAKGELNHKIHDTVFCALMLTVYYRYLPSTARKKPSANANKPVETAADKAKKKADKEAESVDDFF